MRISPYSGATANNSGKQKSQVKKAKSDAVLSPQAKYRMVNVPRKAAEVF